MKRFFSAIGILAISASVFSACKSNKETKSEDTAIETVKKEIPAGSIVFFDLDRVLEEYDMANDLRGEVQTKVEAIQKDINRRQKSLENAVKDFQNKYNKGLMTSAVAAEQGGKLEQQQQNFQEYAQKKQAEIMEEQQVLMNKLADAIKTYLEEYNLDKGYSMILSNQASVPVVVGDSSLNITDDVIKGLNAQYVKEKNNE